MTSTPPSSTEIPLTLPEGERPAALLPEHTQHVDAALAMEVQHPSPSHTPSTLLAKIVEACRSLFGGTPKRDMGVRPKLEELEHRHAA